MHEAAHHSLDLAWLIPAFPLAGVVILFLGRRHLKEPASGWIATLMMAASFVTAVLVALELMSFDEHERQVYEKGVEWITAGGFSVRFSLLVDPLSITMVLFVTGVGAL
ncbi:MAG TPA: NADH-quinone oxidoreductase subunit L, partial [Acidimicrobiia bacterium]|nr:NADH-quinone oxidoreductase subunit L [Acidimicrobiia bacterium]